MSKVAKKEISICFGKKKLLPQALKVWGEINKLKKTINIFKHITILLDFIILAATAIFLKINS
jgi:hypothetical protein